MRKENNKTIELKYEADAGYHW